MFLETVFPSGFHRRKEVNEVLLVLFINMFTSRGFASGLAISLWDVQTCKIRLKEGKLLMNECGVSIWKMKKLPR